MRALCPSSRLWTALLLFRYLAICGCDGSTAEAPGSCATGGLIAATYVMRFCFLMMIIDRSIFLCCAKGKESTLKIVFMIETVIVPTAMITNYIMNIRDKHGPDAYVFATVGPAPFSMAHTYFICHECLVPCCSCTLLQLVPHLM